jgi:hypothetical protein
LKEFESGQVKIGAERLHLSREAAEAEWLHLAV